MALEVDAGEVRRYLGVRGSGADERLEALIDGAVRDLQAAIDPKYIARSFPLLRRAEGVLAVEGLALPGAAIEKALEGCDAVYLFAATLGLGPDRLIARAQAAGQIARAMALQAGGAALIEAWCDEVNRALCARQAESGRFLRPRFSPGYGDLPLACQEGLFRLLGVQKHIGVTLTESLLMVPTKSVTAIIGIADTPRKAKRGCAACGKRDCAYRANEEDRA